MQHLRGESQDAEALLRTALVLDPGNVDATENLEQLRDAAGGPAAWRASETLGGPDPAMPERAFPGMPHTDVMAEHAARYAFAMGLVGEVARARPRLRHRLRQRDAQLGRRLGPRVRPLEPEPHERPAWPGGAQLTYGHDLCADPLPPADAAVAFEVVEHLADAPAMLRTTFEAAPLMILSFPNPKWHGSHHNPHHVNDWTLEEVEGHLRDAVPAGRELELRHLWQDSAATSCRPRSRGLVLDPRGRGARARR